MEQFSLLKLPYLPFRDSVKLMNVHEKYKLTKSSKQNKRIVMAMKFKIHSIHTLIDKKRCGLHLSEYRNSCLAAPVAFYEREEDFRCFVAEEDAPEERNVTSDPLTDCLSLRKQYCLIFKVQFRAFYYILFEDPEKAKKDIAKLLAEEYDSLTLFDSSLDMGPPKMIDTGVLNCLMDSYSLESSLTICGLMPNDFKHEKALKFNWIHYTHCKWISLNDLKSIRNIKHFSISNTIFDCSDINEILHYWVDCEEDMMENLCITLKEGEDLIEERIFEGLLSIPIKSRSGRSVRMIKINLRKRREFVFGEVNVNHLQRSVSLTALKNDGKYESYLSVFGDLENERILKKELMEIEKGLKKNRNNRSEILERKAEIERKITKIQMRLMEFEI